LRTFILFRLICIDPLASDSLTMAQAIFWKFLSRSICPIFPAVVWTRTRLFFPLPLRRSEAVEGLPTPPNDLPLFFFVARAVLRGEGSPCFPQGIVFRFSSSARRRGRGLFLSQLEPKILSSPAWKRIPGPSQITDPLTYRVRLSCVVPFLRLAGLGPCPTWLRLTLSIPLSA